MIVRKVLTAFRSHLFASSSLKFPYLVLLLSGGHGLLALARGVEDFVLLGTALDAAPGEVLDKLSRRLKLNRLPNSQLANVSGGRAIELIATQYPIDPTDLFPLPSPRQQDRDCDFSFSGVYLSAERLIESIEMEQCADDTPTNLSAHCLTRICATILHAMTRVICQRTQRAFDFLRLQSPEDFPQPTALVVSGGVASNSVIRTGLTQLANYNSVPLIAPPPKFCVDNGVMIAWNGLLLHRLGRRICKDPSVVDFQPKAPFGIDCRALVRESHIKQQPVKYIQSLFGVSA